MRAYYRIQPAGLGIEGHYSATSADCPLAAAREAEGLVSWLCGPDCPLCGGLNVDYADGIHVFTSPEDVAHTDGDLDGYGDEVVVILAAESWDNEDVEGECVDPDEARVVARYPLSVWLSLLERAGRI